MKTIPLFYLALICNLALSTCGASTEMLATKTLTIETAIAVAWTVMPRPPEIIDDKGVTMRLVPAGDFTMGSDSDSDNRNPSHRVYLDAFYMDKYEVTNAHYADCVTIGVCDPPHETKSDFRSSYYGNSLYENFQ